MPYYIHSKIVGQGEKIEYIALTPDQVARGVRDEYPDLHVLEEKRQQDLAGAATQAAEDWAERMKERKTFDTREIAEIQKKEREVLGAFWGHYRQW